MIEHYLTRTEAAKYLTSHGLPVARNTLQKWATVGGGPLYRRFGTRALYLPEDLDRWVEIKLGTPRASTAGGV